LHQVSSKYYTEENNKMQFKGSTSRMAGLFLYAAIAQGAVAALITFLGAFGDQLGLYPVAVARVIAAGEAGTWFTVGYAMYIMVGVIAMAVTSLFYFYIEIVQGKPYRGVSKVFAWIHLVLGNVGVAGAAILTMVGGYLGGAAMQPMQSGGSGFNTGQVHVNILGFYTVPIAAFLAVALIGFALGGLGYILTMHQRT
jgi:vacuolar-type H+-ATPase subunit I/STV1